MKEPIIPQDQTVRGEATATNTSRQWLRIPVGSMNMWRNTEIK